MCSAFQHLGHSVTLVGVKNDDTPLCEISEAYNLGPEIRLHLLRGWRGTLGRLRFISQALTEALSFQCNVIYTRDVYVAFASVLAGRNVVYESHSTENDSWLNVIAYRCVRKSPMCKTVVVISDALRKFHVSLHGASPKIIVLHDAADIFRWPDTFSGMASSGREIYQRPKIGYAGSIQPGRGIEIIAELAKRRAEADFYVWGGTDEVVEQYKKKYALLGNLKFAGYLEPKAVPIKLAGCDILLAPYGQKVTIGNGAGNTSSWMSPMKIFEYMAVGRPIIASRHKTIQEVLEHNLSALLCEPEAADEWEGALMRLLSDKVFAAFIAKNAQVKQQGEYTWTQRADQVLQLFAGT